MTAETRDEAEGRGGSSDPLLVAAEGDFVFCGAQSEEESGKERGREGGRGGVM